MIEVLVEFGWNYVSVVHTEGDYGSTGYEALLAHAKNDSRVCLADPLVIQVSSKVIPRKYVYTKTTWVTYRPYRPPHDDPVETFSGAQGFQISQQQAFRCQRLNINEG